MKRRIKLFVLLVLSVHLSNSFAQVKRSYVIISFEDVYKISQHGKRGYYWIVESDSLKSYGAQPSYLFLNFSKQNLADCCKGVDVDPFLIFPDTKFERDTLHSRDLEKLREIILKNRRKIQEVKKKWASGQTQSITVYATPVSGNFCASNFHPIGQQRQGYRGRVYMPFSSFEYAPDFWKSPGSKVIQSSDFATIKFDAITY